MPFVRGDPNINRDGRPKKGETITDVMQKYLKGNYAVGEKKVKRIKLFVGKVFNMAMKGDVAAMRLLWNYVDGMPPQKMEITGEEGGPLGIVFLPEKVSPDEWIEDGNRKGMESAAKTTDSTKMPG